MQARLIKKEQTIVVFSHYTESVEFDLSYFESGKGIIFEVPGFTEPDSKLIRPFEELNEYWANCSPVKQQAIFNVYKKIRNVVDTEFSADILRNKISNLVTELMAHHPYDELFTLVLMSGRYIHVPDTFSDDFDPATNNIIGTRERTYTKDDYRKLLVMSIGLRLVGAIWGEYIRQIEQEAGNTWKEYYAFKLVRNSWIPNCEPYYKLAVYIEANIQAKIVEKGPGILSPALFEGISSEDYPEWLMAIIIMKRVVFADIYCAASNAKDLVVNVYTYIGSKMDNPPTGFRGKINDKTVNSDTLEGDGKLSIFESYKSKADIAQGEIVMIEDFVRNIETFATYLEPNIDLVSLREVVDSSQALLGHQIGDGQVTIMQWVVSNYIPARSIPYLDKQYVVIALAITQCVLRHRGFDDLAALMSAYPLPTGDGLMMVGDDTQRIPRDIQEELDAFYPYARRATAKVSRRKPNPANTSITNVHQKLIRNNWFLTLPDRYLGGLAGVQHTRHYVPLPNLKTSLAKLVIDLNRRAVHELPSTRAAV